MTIRRTLAVLLAATAIGAPAAAAKPVDMHASAAQAAAQAQHRQDLRSPDAIDAARRPAASVNAPGATAVESQSIPPAPAGAVATSDDGTDWLTIGLGIAGTLLVLGAIAAMTSRSRRLPRTRVSV